MKDYYWYFINFEQNNLARLLSIAEFMYNNTKNASFGHTSFKMNCGYYFQVLYKDNVDHCFKSKSVDKLSKKLSKLIIICKKNLYYTQKLQKRAYNKGVKPKSYVPNDKIWLNSKYIKTKPNWNLEVKFFEPFQVFYPVEKQAYKLKLFRK